MDDATLLNTLYGLGLNYAIDIVAMRREDAPDDLADEDHPSGYVHGYLDALESIHEHLMESDPLQLCDDCGSRADYYMVQNDVWTAAGNPSSDGIICIACLEDRLDRRLTRDDFPQQVPVNQLDGPHAAGMTKRLKARLRPRIESTS